MQGGRGATFARRPGRLDLFVGGAAALLILSLLSAALARSWRADGEHALRSARAAAAPLESEHARLERLHGEFEKERDEARARATAAPDPPARPPAPRGRAAPADPPEEGAEARRIEAEADAARRLAAAMLESADASRSENSGPAQAASRMLRSASGQLEIRAQRDGDAGLAELDLLVGTLLVREGSVARAAGHLGRALARLGPTLDPARRRTLAMDLAAAQLAAGDPLAAAGTLDDAAADFEDAPLPERLAFGLLQAGTLEQSNRALDAARALEGRIALIESAPSSAIGEPAVALAAATLDLAVHLHRRPDAGKAEPVARRAEELLGPSADPALRMRIALRRAWIALDLGRGAEATELHRAALALLDAGVPTEVAIDPATTDYLVVRHESSRAAELLEIAWRHAERHGATDAERARIAGHLARLYAEIASPELAERWRARERASRGEPEPPAAPPGDAASADAPETGS